MLSHLIKLANNSYFSIHFSRYRCGQYCHPKVIYCLLSSDLRAPVLWREVLPAAQLKCRHKSRFVEIIMSGFLSKMSKVHSLCPKSFENLGVFFFLSKFGAIIHWIAKPDLNWCETVVFYLRHYVDCINCAWIATGCRYRPRYCGDVLSYPVYIPYHLFQNPKKWWTLRHLAPRVLDKEL